MADLDTNETNEVTVADELGVNKLKVNTDGSVDVNPTVPSTPSGAVSVVIETFSDVTSTAGIDTFHTITNGTTITIQLLQAGAEEETGGSVIELFEDANGDLSVLVRIGLLIVNGASNNLAIEQDFVGNGTRRIVMRRRGYTASAREIEGRWIGFEE